VGVERVARSGCHSFDEYLLAFPQVVLLLLGQFNSADFTRYEDILGFHRHHLVGQLVDADERGDILAVAVLQFHDTPHVARLKQIFLVLVREDVPEVGTVEVGFLPDTVDAQHDVSGAGLLEREPRVGA